VPTALDNGQRSTRKLLASVVSPAARLENTDGHEERDGEDEPENDPHKNGD
jgi:hypothetical protein